MAEPKFFNWPEKAKGGYTVRVFFKKMEDALDWMKTQGVIGDNSVGHMLDASEKKALENTKREHTWLRKAVRKWIGRPV